MRYLIILSVLILLTSCISKKRLLEATAEYNTVLAEQQDYIAAQVDSIERLTIGLAEARGGNEMLLRVQDQLQQRLIEQDDQLESVEGNLSSQMRELRTELVRANRQREAAEQALDSTLQLQQEYITDFQGRINYVSTYLAESLDGKLDSEDYFITSRSGEATLSIQEEVLFRPRSVTLLQDKAGGILTLVTDLLNGDPLLKLIVIGHTDNQPNPRRSTSNWAYAALRATTLADVLASDYYVSPNRLTAASQGEFGPARSNSTEQGRRSNRRVDFVFTNNVSNLTRALNRLVPKADN